MQFTILPAYSNGTIAETVVFCEGTGHTMETGVIYWGASKCHVYIYIWVIGQRSCCLSCSCR